MKDSTHVTRYLLGELSEDEQARIEEAYFGDPRIFDEVETVESALVDDYVRGRLPPEVRQRFEQFYLAHPRRRARVKFAEALVTRLADAAEPGVVGATPSVRPGFGWRTWLDARRSPKPALGFALGALLLIVSYTVGIVIESRRVREAATQTEAARAEQERRQRELQAQAAAERARAEQLAARTPSGAQPTAPQERPAAPVVTLALNVGPGVRGTQTGTPATLFIPAGTQEVRLQLSLRENDYPSYRVMLRAVGGSEILRRGDLKPSTASAGPAFALALPASQFGAGDYMLTLQGATAGGEFEDVSQSLFRVERQ